MTLFILAEISITHTYAMRMNKTGSEQKLGFKQIFTSSLRRQIYFRRGRIFSVLSNLSRVRRKTCLSYQQPKTDSSFVVLWAASMEAM